MELIPAILMFTIGDDDFRVELMKRLSELYGDAISLLDQSTYAIPLRNPRPADDVQQLAQLCGNIQQDLQQELADEDTIYLCCSAARLNYRHDDIEYDQLAVFNVKDEVPQLRRRLRLRR